MQSKVTAVRPLGLSESPRHQFYDDMSDRRYERRTICASVFFFLFVYLSVSSFCHYSIEFPKLAHVFILAAQSRLELIYRSKKPFKRVVKSCFYIDGRF